MKVVLLTRAIAPANALIRALDARGWLHLLLIEDFPAGKPKSMFDRLKSKVEQRLDRSEEELQALDRRAVKLVYGDRALPLKAVPPMLELPNKMFAGAERALEAIRPELVVTFGTSIVPKGLCATASIAALNLHAGIAPRYRGTYCVQHALLNGELDAIGSTIHLLRPKVDGGEIVAQARPRIDAGDDELVLAHRVHDAGHRLLISIIERLERGIPLKPVAQPASGGRLFKMSDYTPALRAELRKKIASGFLARASLAATSPLVSIDDAMPALSDQPPCR